MDRGVRKGVVPYHQGGVDRKVVGIYRKVASGVDLRVEVVGGGGLVKVGGELDPVRNEVGVDWLKEGSGGNDVGDVGEVSGGVIWVNRAIWPRKESSNSHLPGTVMTVTERIEQNQKQEQHKMIQAPNSLMRKLKNCLGELVTAREQ
jgi:hypothetical protein